MQFVSLNDMPEEFQNMIKKQYVEATSNVKPYGVVYQEAYQSLEGMITQLIAAMNVLEEAQNVNDVNLSRIIMNSAAEKLGGMVKTLDASILRVKE
jgi:hypothetical protein